MLNDVSVNFSRIYYEVEFKRIILLKGSFLVYRFFNMSYTDRTFSIKYSITLSQLRRIESTWKRKRKQPFSLSLISFFFSIGFVPGLFERKSVEALLLFEWIRTTKLTDFKRFQTRHFVNRALFINLSTVSVG